MRTLKLQKRHIKLFLERIRTEYELWGPVQRNSHYLYEKIDDLETLIIKPVKTLLPVKKIIIPSYTEMLKFRDTECEDLQDTTIRVVFGPHPCEIHSLLMLDRIFHAQYPDPYYIRRRENTILIALSCEPDETCFCKSTGTHTVSEGFDIALNDLGNFYLVWVLTSKGDDLVRLGAELFDELTVEDVKKYTEWRQTRDAMFNVEFDFMVMPDLMDLNYHSSIWEDFATKCLSCGACSMVCPTCNCFNVVDEINFTTGEVTRSRHWDSCMFKEYSMVAGGFNFRESRAARLRLWYTHKLRSFGELRLPGVTGKPSCVGCGRCVETCPVGINVLTVMEALTTGRVTFDWRTTNLVKKGQNEPQSV